MQKSNPWPSVSIHSNSYLQDVWPRFSLLGTIIYIRLPVTITSVILVRFSLDRHLLCGLCGGAWFQHVPTRNVPSQLRPDKTRAPRVPSKIGSFLKSFFLPHFGRILDPGQCSRHGFHFAFTQWHFLKFWLLSGKLDQSESSLQWCLTYMYILVTMAASDCVLSWR